MASTEVPGSEKLGGDRVHSTLHSLSVIVPVHNGGEAFRRCLVALKRGISATGRPGEPPDIEIVVVADGESDGSWRLAEEFGARLILLPESRGPAQARNIGARAAEGDILFFVDADVEIHLDTLARVIESFSRDPQLAALIGSYDDAPGHPDFLSQYRNLLHHYTHQTARLEACTFWGACGAIRRAVFLAVDGFDENYRRPCIEDIELGYRLKQAGHKIHLRKDIQVKHLKQWTPFSLLRADVFYRALPWMALLLQIRQTHPEQYRRFTSDLNLKWDSRISVLLVATLSVSLAIAPFYSGGYFVALSLGLLLTLVNLPLYAFFHRKRGLFFALRTVPWHWLYFLYSGAAYCIGLIRHRLRLYSLSR